MSNNYIVIGDSITYGIGDFESGGWSAMFKNFIANKDDTKVCNNYVHVAGYPGATSTNILKIKYISMQDVLQKEDFIDGLHPNKNGHRKIFKRIIDNIEGENYI